MKKSFWIWYPGDFELYHGMKQNFSRVERGYGWPAFWKSDSFRCRVVFRCSYVLHEETEFTVYSRCTGYVLAGDKKYAFGEKISCPPGEISVSIHAACIETFPCVYVDGKIIYSDGGWTAEDYSYPHVPVGLSRYYDRAEQDPSIWKYDEKIYYPVNVRHIQGGVLYEFETELTAELHIHCSDERLKAMRVYYGESENEALDLKNCYYSFKPDESGKTPRCAFKYVFIPGKEVNIHACHQYVDFPKRASFKCSDPLLNKIWEVSEHTFRLCSGIFFIDGVKRDKWIWSGDAYQSFLINRYLMADADIDRRTLLALRGNDPMTAHINTIMDYSFLWVSGVREHFDFYLDSKFLVQIYPKVISLLDFCTNRTDENGFITSKQGDWVFIDWADIDKDGPVGAEQILFAAALDAAAHLSKALGYDGEKYTHQKNALIENINKFYWDSEKGAYIDSYASGARYISRQTNLFAVYFGIASPTQCEQIMRSVIEDDAINEITTPYFKFFEMDVLGKMGYHDRVMKTIRDYWGGMLRRGASTFWEKFDPNDDENEQYDMYGDKFGKSLCHAWGANPIYFISKYFVGLEAIGGRFVLSPKIEYFSHLDCILPLDGTDGYVRTVIDNGTLSVETNRLGGILKLGNERYALSKPSTVIKI